MRILMIGAGGVGSAAAKILVERDFFEALVVADYSAERAEASARAASASSLRAASTVRASGARLASISMPATPRWRRSRGP